MNLGNLTYVFCLYNRSLFDIFTQVEQSRRAKSLNQVSKVIRLKWELIIPLYKIDTHKARLLSEKGPSSPHNIQTFLFFASNPSLQRQETWGQQFPHNIKCKSRNH